MNNQIETPMLHENTLGPKQCCKEHEEDLPVQAGYILQVHSLSKDLCRRLCVQDLLARFSVEAAGYLHKVPIRNLHRRPL